MSRLPFIFTLVVVATTFTGLAQSPWTITLLDQPFHIGDTVVKTMKQPEPQGAILEKGFDLPDAILPSYIYVTLWISDMIPKNHPDLKKGLYNNELQINGQIIAILNKKIDPPEGPTIQKITLQQKGSVLMKGSNTLAIIAGASVSNLDDFEVHRIVVSKDRP